MGKVTSAERGTLVTMCTVICTNRNYFPPYFIFPRQHFEPHLLNGAPVGFKGPAFKTEWMTADSCLKTFSGS